MKFYKLLVYTLHVNNGYIFICIVYPVHVRNAKCLSTLLTHFVSNA